MCRRVALKFVNLAERPLATTSRQRARASHWTRQQQTTNRSDVEIRRINQQRHNGTTIHVLGENVDARQAKKRWCNVNVAARVVKLLAFLDPRSGYHHWNANVVVVHIEFARRETVHQHTQQTEPMRLNAQSMNQWAGIVGLLVCPKNEPMVTEIVSVIGPEDQTESPTPKG